jgi:chromosome segregation ATPase
MSGGSAKFWLCVSMFANVVAVFLLIATPGQRPAKPAEPVQSINSEMNSQIESLTTQVQELTREFQDLNRSLQEHSLSVADQKQLANRISQLSIDQSNTWFAVQRLTSRSPESLESPEQRKQRYETNISALRERLKEQEKVVEAGNQQLQELASRMPAEVRNLDIDSGLKDLMLEQYWPYFKARAQFSDMARLAQQIDLKIAQEQVEANSGP